MIRITANTLANRLTTDLTRLGSAQSRLTQQMASGKRLIDATIEDAARKGFHRIEYWTQDRAAQRFYVRLGLKEIGRHYRFRMRPPKEAIDLLAPDRVGIEYLYAACLPEEWPLVKQKYDIIEKRPLEPHLCVGYEIRF